MLIPHITRINHTILKKEGYNRIILDQHYINNLKRKKVQKYKCIDDYMIKSSKEFEDAKFKLLKLI